MILCSSTLLLHFYSSSSSAEEERPTPSADDTLLRAIESKIKSVDESDDHEAVRFLSPFVCRGDVFS